jgi:hypothetical protein
LAIAEDYISYLKKSAAIATGIATSIVGFIYMVTTYFPGRSKNKINSI